MPSTATPAANTLGHVAEAAGGLDLPALPPRARATSCRWSASRPPSDPVVHGRLHPLGPGKDTITGHWELMGVITPVALRTYPDGFPEEVLARCGRPAAAACTATAPTRHPR